MKVFFKKNLFTWLSLFKLNNLKVIYNLYSQCLTQTLSKTTSKSYTEGVCRKFIGNDPSNASCQTNSVPHGASEEAVQ